MLLNGIRLTGYSSTDDAAQFELAETTVKEVAALDGQLLTVTEDDGAEVEAFVGYSVDYIKRDGETVRMRAVKVMDDTTAAAIESLNQKAADNAAKAAAASKKADEAKRIAEQAGTSPSVRAASAMYVNASPLTDTQLGDVRYLIEDFVPGSEYAKGLVRRHAGSYYRMAKDIDKQTSTTYQPGEGTESLYTLIDLAEDGIRIWHQPTDATNSFALNEKCHHPGAFGPVYTSKRDGNTSEPGADEWWVLEGEAE